MHKDLFYIEDKDVEFGEVIEAPLPKAPLDTAGVGRWLATAGVQPVIPENPPLEAPSENKIPDSKEDRVSNEVKTPVKHVLSIELQLDKVSVLEDAIEYMKTLQEKVKILEEQTPETNSKSVRFEMVTDDVDNSSSNEKVSCLSNQLPEIKTRFSAKDVLIRVYCVKKLGAVEKTLAEIEKLHLSVINSSAIIFANSALHITVIAQMDKDLSMTMKELVKNLRFGLKQFM